MALVRLAAARLLIFELVVDSHGKAAHYRLNLDINSRSWRIAGTAAACIFPLELANTSQRAEDNRLLVVAQKLI